MDHTKHSGAAAASTFFGAQRQHLDNLHALLRSCIDHADFSTAASVSAVLLQAHKPGVGSGSKGESRMSASDRDFDYLLMVCSEVLKREPFSPEQVRSCLRSMAQSHASLYAVEITRMVLAMLLIEQGELQQAVLILELNAAPSNAAHQARTMFSFTRHALTGLVRHRQLLDIMYEAAGSRAAASSLRPSSGREQGAPSSPTPLTSLVFAYDSRTWLKARSNRQLKEVWRECEKQLKDALVLFPGYTLLSYALCHAYVVSGKFGLALEAATSGCAAAPHDVDALTLQCLIRQVWKEQQGAAEAEDPEAPEHDVVRDMAKLLQLDGTCQPALIGLLSHCSHCSGCMLAAAIGCMRHLDMSCCPGAPTALAPLAWACLSATLCGLAEEQLQPSAPGEHDDDNSPQRGAGTSAAASGDASPSPQPDREQLDPSSWPLSADGRWTRVQRELELRGHWAVTTGW